MYSRADLGSPNIKLFKKNTYLKWPQDFAHTGQKEREMVIKNSSANNSLMMNHARAVGVYTARGCGPHGQVSMSVF